MENQQLAFLARQSADARSIQLGPNKVTFLISGEETGGIFSLTEFEAAPPPRRRPHCIFIMMRMRPFTF